MFTSFFCWKHILDIIYPPICVGCEEEGEWVCRNCVGGMHFFKPEAGEGPVILGYYADPLLRRLLTRLKYHAATCVLPAVSECTRRFRFERQAPWPWAGEDHLTLCVVPSDERRVRERGIDHAETLANIVQTELVPWATRSNILRRKRRASPNANLPHDERRQANVHNLFESVIRVQGPVLLVDDVYTTGATWHEAARVLQEAGATRVYGFVFAKG